MKKKIYSPYLSIYKPQIGNMISILERITGIFLIIVLFNILIIKELSDYFLINYNYYYYYYFIMKGNSILIEIILIFVILNYLYHILFIPIIFSNLNKIKGEIVDYRYQPYTVVLKNFLIKIILLILCTIICYLYFI